MHRKQEHPFSMFKCPSVGCDKEFTTTQLLNRHTKRLHENKSRYENQNKTRAYTKCINF